MTSENIAFGEADLTNCEREQIQFPGSIQPHGVLLVLEPTSLRVHQGGGDIKGILGLEISDVLGCPLSPFLAPEDAKKLSALSLQSLARPQHQFTLSYADGKSADAIAHASGNFLILELEPRLDNDPEDALALVQAMIQQVQHAETVQASYRAIVDQVRQAVGFDRVMLYRFLSDGSGSVEAEARSDAVDAYLGLRYPASDIPPQARALYLRNWTRLIGDAAYVPSPLMGLRESTSGSALDLSQSLLRSVSPTHLEYLANMGVAASMSLSIVIGGKLWGLIACHHQDIRFPGYRRRAALELFAQMASFQLETKLEAADLGSRLNKTSINAELIASLSPDLDFSEGLNRFKPKLLEYIPAAGVILWIDGRYSAFGKTPKIQDVTALVRWLNNNVSDGVFDTDRLSLHYNSASSLASTACGILALSISRAPRDYIIWFRPELVQTVTWAGDPKKPVVFDGGQTRISPRKSFNEWKQQVRMQSEPWTSLDRRTAMALRLSLLEVVLQHTDQLAREREASRVQQQALLAELDQRVQQWEAVAQELKKESDRRAIVEEELSQVLRRTVLEQESERQRIARELHDSLGQYLTVMRLDLDGIGRSADATEPIRRQVERLKKLTTDVGQEVNHLAWEIRPTALDDLGLQTALHQFLEEWAERSSLQFDLHLSLEDRRLPPPIETALYRVLQEAIRNVVKHAEASRVGVILEASQTEVRLIVEDDGKGFNWDSEDESGGPSNRLGLVGVRERLALVGGSLEVETAPGAGTTLLVHVPL